MSKKEKMPTPDELINAITSKGVYNRHSIAYGHSRTILNKLHKPVLAYGLGLGAFVCVYTDGHRFPKAEGYSAKRLFDGQTEGGFHNLDVDEALKIIEKHPFIVAKSVDEKKLKEALNRKKFTRPVVGKIRIKKHRYLEYSKSYEDSVFEMTVERYKNGKYRITRQSFWKDTGGWKHTIDTRSFLEEYFFALKGEGYAEEGDTKKSKAEILESTVTDELIEDMKKQAITSTI